MLPVKQIRIILSGASSVGKTTVARDFLEKEPSFGHIDEIARAIMEEKNINNEDLHESLGTDKRLFLQFQEQILAEQYRHELKFDEHLQSYVSDRGLDPLAYAGDYCSLQAQEALSDSQAARKLLERYKDATGQHHATLMVLMYPLKSVQDDGVRLVQKLEEQLRFTARLREILKMHAIPFVEMRCTDRQERIRFLQEIVAKLH